MGSEFIELEQIVANEARHDIVAGTMFLARVLRVSEAQQRRIETEREDQRNIERGSEKYRERERIRETQRD